MRSSDVGTPDQGSSASGTIRCGYEVNTACMRCTAMSVGIPELAWNTSPTVSIGVSGLRAVSPPLPQVWSSKKACWSSTAPVRVSIS